MNIVYFSHYFSPEIGAPSARIYDLSRCWLSTDDQVEVVTCFPNHPHGKVYSDYQVKKYEYEKLDGIDVHRNWSYITPNKGFIKKTLGHVSMWASSRLFSFRKLKQPEIIIGTSPTFFAAMAGLRAAAHHNVPFVMEVRDLWPAIFVELGVLTNKTIISLLERWELWMYRRATKIVTVTEAFRQDLIQRGIPADKVHTIPNGADTTYWLPKPKPAELADKLQLQDKFVVLYIGTHGISQALHSVVTAASMLNDQPDIHFLFVGAGADKQKLINQSEELKLKNITFHDPVTKAEMNDFYALSDLCLIPLRDIPLFDTFIPSKMFEVMAMERPIIGSLRGESAEILMNSGSSIVVEPEDSQALAKAIQEVYKLPRNERMELGKNGRKFVDAHYSRMALSKTYKNVLKEAIQEYK
ncbi:MAG: glycosyltransferase family 4 protein [Anaerolineae bacterium]